MFNVRVLITGEERIVLGVTCVCVCVIKVFLKFLMSASMQCYILRFRVSGMEGVGVGTDFVSIVELECERVISLRSTEKEGGGRTF